MVQLRIVEWRHHDTVGELSTRQSGRCFLAIHVSGELDEDLPNSILLRQSRSGSWDFQTDNLNAIKEGILKDQFENNGSS